MKFIKKVELKYRKLNTLGRLQSCLHIRRQKIQKIGTGEASCDVLLTKTKNGKFKDKPVIGCKDLENLKKFVPPRYLGKSTKESFIYDGSFYQAIGSVLLMAEFFAIMPVRGVKGRSPNDLSFSWSSIRTIYCIVVIVGVLVDTALTAYVVLNGSISFHSIEPLIFRVSNVIACISFLHLAKNWPEVMRNWRAVEKQLPGFVTQLEKRQMAAKIHIVVFVSMMLSLVEHILNIISLIHHANFCPITDDPIEDFFLRSNNQIFYVFSYSVWLAWYGKILHVLMTFTWNYMDCFVMIVSIGLTNLFKQINENMMRHKGMKMSSSYWSERRIQYRNLCVLCENVDNAISVITMVSFSNNLYFICIQLLRSMNKMPSFAHALYFYFSLIYLLGRTLAVSLYSADIHDESKKPQCFIRCVPSESWCQDVKRFSDEVSTDLVALSGMKFFHLTRKLVLSVAGTIVTYELVLIQFREDNKIWDCERKDLLQ
ncbi:gustatory receptor for sugar taste 64f-like [Eupeodes corollae]|uniref:gustatory receptor for sugar taste 64f-like n=1 Tax=Eupeodes corollae TaxID=290404 RepID=UPI0024902637|nr:gustatory receptor for sugar taste 64f-like [Eupeodes corollae]